MINQSVLMSGTQYFTDEFAINAYMDSSVAIDSAKAQAEHNAIKSALESAGVDVIQVPAPENCQDGVYTANWGLCRDDFVILSSLPNKRQDEEWYARQMLEDIGKEVIPAPYRFSGQGDALPCGDLLFCGSDYRTDPRMHQFVAENLGFEVVGLQTVPKLSPGGQPVTNLITGWPDSFFYDLDLALAIITPDLIAWCPEAFMPASQRILRGLAIEKIEVSLDEAMNGFACNLVSTGETVVMSAQAPVLQNELESRGFQVITPTITELAKGGGYIRCTTLTLANN